MREILFRGKRIDNGEWVCGDLIQLHDGRKFIVNNKHGACIDNNGNFINTESPFVCEISRETMGQYTGLTDKNGVKIFDGDIVSFKRYNVSGYTTCRVGDVRFYDKLPIFYVMAATGDAWGWEECYEITVIGNIHDNPELLKGDKYDGSDN